MPLLSNAFPENVAAFTSDASIDFKFKENQTTLMDDQRRYLSESMGVGDVVNIRQVHGKAVVKASKDLVGDADINDADAIVTDEVDVPIAIRTADCVPVFLYDPAHQAIGIVHAGWQSTQKKIVQETLKTMRQEYGTNPEDVQVILGPAIQEKSFEVTEEFKEYFPDEIKKEGGKLYVDVPQANKNQLKALGVKEENIHDKGEDTYSQNKYFSFRRDGDAAGRMIHVLMLKSE